MPPSTPSSPESFDTHIADRLSSRLEGISELEWICEMSLSERRFLSGLIRQVQPRKILEIGVSAGGSSALILNAIQDNPETHLYSIDFSETYYRDTSKKSGFLVEERFGNFLAQWTLRTGKLAAEYMDEFGGEFDFCFIDTAHVLPGEVLDFLMVLPYLKKSAIVALHDLSLCTMMLTDGTCSNQAYATTLLFNTCKEPKWLPNTYEGQFPTSFPNIGAFRVDNGKESPYIDDLFRTLTLPWQYIPSQYDYEMLVKHFARYYREDQVEYFTKVYHWQIQLQTIQQKKHKSVFQKIWREVKRPFRKVFKP